jgi:hypothetical protein
MPAGGEAANRGRLILHCELVAPVRGPMAESFGSELAYSRGSTSNIAAIPTADDARIAAADALDRTPIVSIGRQEVSAPLHVRLECRAGVWRVFALGRFDT